MIAVVRQGSVPGYPNNVLFNSYVFLLFMAVVLPAWHVLPRRYRNGLLLAASYVFYAYWDWRFVFLLLASTLIDYHVAGAMHRQPVRSRRKLLLLISLVANLGILGFFKYFNFFVDSFARIGEVFGARPDALHLHVILPVGISFYTFQTLSYTIDVYRGRLEPSRSLRDFALYVAFFPQLVAGPIERAVNLLPQISRTPEPSREDVRAGLVLITTGMFKKVLVGDTCGRFADQVFAQPHVYSSPFLLAALFLFSIQIYADFSGYSSIARGTARLFGIHLMVNFEQPYLSANITEFWRRWHISLSSWLRDYLYIPLGGNRKGSRRTLINLFATMLLGGLWHGAGWNFVFWGGLHGTYLAAHKKRLGSRKAPYGFRGGTLADVLKFIAGVVATNILVLMSWLFFRAHDVQTTRYFITHIVSWRSAPFAGRVLEMCIGYGVTVLVLDLLEYCTGTHEYLLRLARPARIGFVAAAWTGVLLYMFSSRSMPFIYFQF